MKVADTSLSRERKSKGIAEEVIGTSGRMVEEAPGSPKVIVREILRRTKTRIRRHPGKSKTNRGPGYHQDVQNHQKQHNNNTLDIHHSYRHSQ